MICPKCGGACERDEADVGIGTIGGPWGCPACHWIDAAPSRVEGCTCSENGLIWNWPEHQPGCPVITRPRPKLRVYLAASSADRVLVEVAVRAIVRAGHEITEPWWERIDEAARNGWAHDAVVPGEYMYESARRNREGILNADVIIALARENVGGFSSGCAGEIGYALAERDGERIEPLKKRILLVGNLKGFVWSWLVPAEDRFATIDDALAALA